MSRKAWLLIGVTLLALPAPSGGTGAPVATVTGIHGAVEIRERGAPAWSPVTSTRPVAEGATLRVRAGGQALLLQPGCPPRALKADDLVLVSARKRWLTGISARPLTEAQHRSLLQLLSGSARSYRSAPTAVRPGEPDRQIALSPRAEQVPDGHPTFAWRVDDPRSRSVVELFRSRQVIWSGRTVGGRLSYAADRPPLKPGSYQWQVYVRPPGEAARVDGAVFSVPERGAAARIREEIAAARALMPREEVNLPLIAAYVRHQLYSPAEAELHRALAREPNNGELQRLLAHVHRLMGRAEESVGTHSRIDRRPVK
jgi:hypothetical protein